MYTFPSALMGTGDNADRKGEFETGFLRKMSHWKHAYAQLRFWWRKWWNNVQMDEHEFWKLLAFTFVEISPYDLKVVEYNFKRSRQVWRETKIVVESELLLRVISITIKRRSGEKTNNFSFTFTTDVLKQGFWKQY